MIICVKKATRPTRLGWAKRKFALKTNETNEAALGWGGITKICAKKQRDQRDWTGVG